MFREALGAHAAALIAFHNHPSGDPTPTEEDVELTQRLAAAGTIVGVDVLVIWCWPYAILVDLQPGLPHGARDVFDCFSGAAGDMILAALIGGPAVDDLERRLARRRS